MSNPCLRLGAVGVLALAAWGAFGSTPEPRALQALANSWCDAWIRS